MAARWVAVCRAGTSAGRGVLLYPAGLRRRPLPAAGGDWLLLMAPATSAGTWRPLHLGRVRADKELHRPSSKVEEAVESLRDQLKGATEPPPIPPAPPAAPPAVAPQPEPPVQPPPAAAVAESTPPVPAAAVATPDASAEKRLAVEPPRRTLWIRFVDEVKHYYHGFKLLFININISRKLIWRILNGESLSRRENRQLVRTVGDLFRVLPFSIFIIIPFMELLLPVFIKLFPNMLPSTFQTANAEDAKMKQKLKVKLETAKFLQKTLDSMALKGKGHYSDSAREFADFFKEIRTSGEQASNEQILKFSKLFEDEVTLDSLDRPQLAALCRVLEVPPFGTNNFLRFLIQMKLRGLKADDRIIQRESVDTMTVEELQAACRARGMRAYGVSEQRLRSQLSQWLDLSLNERVPPSLLLLSRALYLPENLPTSDQLKATISRLPDAVGTATRAAIGDREGRVDFKTRVDVIKDEERKILEERAEARALAEAAAQEKLQAEAAAQERLRAAAAAGAGAADTAEVLRDAAAAAPVDRAVPLPETPVAPISPTAAAAPAAAAPEGELTSRDVSEIEGALETLAATRRRPLLEHEELEDIKEEMADYQEDLQDLRDIMNKAGKNMADLKETRAARGLQYSVNRMVRSLDSMINKLQAKEKRLQAAQTNSFDAKRSDEEVGIQELIQTLQHIQSVPDKTKLNTIAHVLSKMDDNQDGSIRVEDVYDVIELMGQDNLKLSSKQMEEIIELLDREKVLDLERRIEKALQKEAEDIAAAAAAEAAARDQQQKQLPEQKSGDETPPKP